MNLVIFVFKTHPLFSTDIAYYDEMEVVNPIGSYVSKLKLGCHFFTLGNISPQHRSTFKAINLVSVGKYEDICMYVMDTPLLMILKHYTVMELKL